jgi:hypothetical protein
MHPGGVGSAMTPGGSQSPFRQIQSGPGCGVLQTADGGGGCAEAGETAARPTSTAAAIHTERDPTSDERAAIRIFSILPFAGTTVGIGL